MLDKFKLLFDILERKKSGPPEYIIAGLGNPGAEYENTRHNAGFMALDRLSGKYKAPVVKPEFQSLCGMATIAGRRVLLIKPQTFMNRSGEAIHRAAAFYKLPMERVIVIYDDVSLPLGKIRLRPKGSAGGHNGIKNIIALTGTELFPRVKIGVGHKPRPDYDLVAWVLSRFSKEDAEKLAPALETAALAAEAIIARGMDEAMNLYNG